MHQATTNCQEPKNIEDGNLINMTATVTDVSPPRSLSTGILREVELTDSSGSVILAVWDQSLERNIIYNFTKLVVHSFRNNKTLSLSSVSTFNKAY